MYQNHLDRAAAAHEKQNRDGSWLRNHLQQRLGFTDEQFAPVRAAAQRLEPELAAIKAKAMVIAKEDRAWYKAQGIDIHPRLADGRDVGNAAAIRSLPQPPGHAQLKQLQQDFENTIQREEESLKNDLGPELAARLDDQIQNQWAGQVTTLRIQPGKLRSLHTPVPRGAKP